MLVTTLPESLNISPVGTKFIFKHKLNFFTFSFFQKMNSMPLADFFFFLQILKDVILKQPHMTVVILQ